MSQKIYTRKEIEKVIPALTIEQKEVTEAIIHEIEHLTLERPNVKIFVEFLNKNTNLLREKEIDEVKIEDYYQIFCDLINKIEVQTTREREEEAEFESKAEVGSNQFWNIICNEFNDRQELREQKAILAKRQNQSKERILITLIAFLLQFSMIFILPRFLPWLSMQVWYIIFFFWLNDITYEILLEADIKNKNINYWTTKILETAILAPFRIINNFCVTWLYIFVVFFTFKLVSNNYDLTLNVTIITYLISIQIYNYQKTYDSYIRPLS